MKQKSYKKHLRAFARFDLLPVLHRVTSLVNFFQHSYPIEFFEKIIIGGVTGFLKIDEASGDRNQPGIERRRQKVPQILGI